MMRPTDFKLGESGRGWRSAPATPGSGWRRILKLEISNPKSGPGVTGGDREGEEGVAVFLLGPPRIQPSKTGKFPQGGPKQKGGIYPPRGSLVSYFRWGLVGIPNREKKYLGGL